MPKETLRIDKFSGGFNDMSDARDIQDGESPLCQNVNLRNKGKLLIHGDLRGDYNDSQSTSDWADEDLNPYGNQSYISDIETFQHFGKAQNGVLADASNTNFHSGYGLFSFTHDYNIGADGTGFIDQNPELKNTEFIVLGDGKYIRIYDSKPQSSGDASYYWYDSEDLQFYNNYSATNQTHNKVEHYFEWANAILRCWDANVDNWNKNGPFYVAHVNRAMWSRISSTLTSQDDAFINAWVTGNSRLPQPANATYSPLWCYREGVTYDGQAPAAYNAGTWSSGTANFCVEGGEKVTLEFEESTAQQTNIADNGFSVPSGDVVTVTTSTDHGFNPGQFVIINGCSIAAINNKYEILATPLATTFTINCDVNASQNAVVDGGLGIAVTEGVCFLDASAIDDNIRTKWIFGITWLYDGESETPVATGKLPVDETIGMAAGLGTAMNASNVIDFSSYTMAPRCKISFRWENEGGINSPSGQQEAGIYDTTEGVDFKQGWNHRITGFRIYAKDVIDSALSSEWQLFAEIDFTTGEYVIEMGNGEVQLIDQSAVQKFKTSGLDEITGLPALTFEAINGYTPDVTTDALYKSAATVGSTRTRYVGNVMLPDSNGDFFDSTGTVRKGILYPDRMMKTPPGQPDVFPNDGFHFVDVAIDDGDEIRHIASFNDRVLQFKEHTLYVINASNPDDEFLEGTFKFAGIQRPSQVVETAQGIIWANDHAVYMYNGENISNLTASKIDWENQ